MVKTPGEHESIKSISKEQREARKAFRQADATTAMNEHDAAQTAFAKNHERLKAERLVREAAAPPAAATKPKSKKKEAASHRPVELDETKVAKSARREWTEDEVRDLRRLANEEVGLGAIAMALGRSTASVRQKAYSLDLSLESNVAVGLKGKP
jgi:hypothetical protein